MALGHQTESAPNLGSSRRYSDHHGPSIVRILLPRDEAVRLELANLPAGSRRIHFGQARQLSDLKSVFLLDASKQLEARLGNQHTGGGGAPAVDLPAGIQAKELFEGLFNRSEFPYLGFTRN